MARVLRFGFSFAVNSVKTRLFSAEKVSFLPHLLARNYARDSLGRTPIKVVVPGKEDDETSWESTSSFEEESPSGVPHYVKLREDSRIFTNLMTIARSRNQREKKQKIVLEGRRLIQDALDAGIEADTLFFSREEALQELSLPRNQGVKLYKITYKQLSLWSDLTTSPGLIGVFNRFSYDQLTLPRANLLPLTVICDNVREPGNLGAILRCAAAVGCKQILLTKGCVDLWESKVLRSACGAHFRASVENNIEWEFVCNYVSNDAAVYLASKPPARDDDEDNDNSDDGFDEPVRRKPRPIQEPIHYEIGEDGRKFQPINDKDLPADGDVPFDSVLYHDVDFGRHKDIVVIIGGETEGLSKAAVKFTYDRYGQSVFIPLQNDIESLNSGVALGVILFEIRRQLRVAAPPS